MIDLTTKIHDKFTLEFKVGFNTKAAEHPMKYSDFVLNTWIFVPNSLDINAAKYSKDDFYRDLKSGVRLITPSYGLHELANDEMLLPSQALITNFNDSSVSPDDTQDLVHAIKMYCAIAKSAVRDECHAIMQQSDTEAIKRLVPFSLTTSARSQIASVAFSIIPTAKPPTKGFNKCLLMATNS